MRIEIQGPWRNIKRIVRQLEQQGWVMVGIPEPNAEFTVSTVIMTRN